MVAARDSASTVGPVESEIFLSDDQPSLYDAFNDLYGEPAKPKKQNRSVAIGADKVREEKPVSFRP